MALNKDRWGLARAAAVQAGAVEANVQPGAEITTTQLETIWKKVSEADIAEFSGHSQVAPGTFSNSGGAVTGTGGPVS